MSAAISPDPELDRLLESLCEQTLGENEASRLNLLLGSQREARWRDLLYMELHGGLHWDQASRQPLDFGSDEAPAFDAPMLAGESEVADEELPRPATMPGAATQENLPTMRPRIPSCAANRCRPRGGSEHHCHPAPKPQSQRRAPAARRSGDGIRGRPNGKPQHPPQGI